MPVGGRLNSKGYVEILEDILKPTMEICYGGFTDMVFMQVNKFHETDLMVQNIYWMCQIENFFTILDFFV